MVHMRSMCVSVSLGWAGCVPGPGSRRARPAARPAGARPFLPRRETVSDSRRVRPRLRLLHRVCFIASDYINCRHSRPHRAHLTSGFHRPNATPHPRHPAPRDERRVCVGLYFFVSPPPGPNPRRTSRLAVTSNARLTAHGDRESRGSRACSRDVGSRVKPYDRHESPT